MFLMSIFADQGEKNSAYKLTCIFFLFYLGTYFNFLFALISDTFHVIVCEQVMES